ncbi:MAG: DUF4190 domain-containing protein [Planctomycetes bacterium]|nr:DUF4190 domain-containing protein [Planctomycetota bacterium]
MSQGSENPFGDNPYGAPQQTGGAPMPVASSEGDATGGVIPYKNVPALLAYYLGLFSLFPCIGLFLAIPAFVLGIKGLRKRREDPAVKGSVHAWIGIVMGGLMTVVWGVAWILGIIGMVAGANGG